MLKSRPDVEIYLKFKVSLLEISVNVTKRQRMLRKPLKFSNLNLHALIQLQHNAEHLTLERLVTKLFSCLHSTEISETDLL